MGRHLRGDRAFARLINRLPLSVDNELRVQLEKTGAMLLARAQALVPVYSGKPRKGVTPGALKDGLSFSVPDVALRLKVGLVGKPTNRRLFYGRFIEFGWRPRRKNRAVKLRPISSAVGSTAYKLAEFKRQQARVPPHHFVYTVNREAIYNPFRQIWGRALRAAAGAGSSDD